VAPFQAVPTPAHGEELAESADLPAAGPDRDVAPARGRRSTDAQRADAASTGPPAEPARRSGTSLSTRPPEAAPGYRDWTTPSRSKDARPVAPPATEAIPDREVARGAGSGTARRAQAPSTELIPDRTPAARDDWDGAWDEDPVDGLDEAATDDRDDAADRGHTPVSGPETGPSTGVVGGRAAFRAERQAAEAERRKEVRRGTGASAAGLADGERRGASGVRRAAAGLLAVAVVALLVLGVYSFTDSGAQEAARLRAPASTPSTSAPPAVPSSVLPPLDVAPLPGVEEPAAAAPETARAPVTVLNATGISGLAADVAEAIGAGGWESPGVGQYQGGDVAVTTVYFTDGDEAQRAAALALIQQYPQIEGPVARFFDVPDVAAPGLVLVTTGEWRP
jgi:hypothetical protein